MNDPACRVLLALCSLPACYSPNETLTTGQAGDGTEGVSEGAVDSSTQGVDTSAGLDSVSESTSSGQADGTSGTLETSDTESTTTSATGPACGDGTVDVAEACDDGVNDGAYGGCLPGCVGLAPRCGDAVVQPVESCDDGNGVDADGCNVDCVVSGSERWTETYSGAGSYGLDANAVAAGPGDDVYVAGSEVVAGGSQAWLRRLDLDGNGVWEETYFDNEASATVAHGLDVDAAGVAYFGGLADYGGNLGAHGWLRAHDDAAALVFSHDAGPEVFDVGVSEDGNAALVASSVALFGFPGEPRGPLLTRRLAALGDTLWSEELDPLPAVEPYAQRLAVDSNEGIVVVANFRAEGTPQAWLRKFTANGTVVWTETMDASGHQERTWLGVACGPDDEVVVVGTVDDEMWMRLFDEDGVEQWTVTDASPGGVAFVNAAIDDDGNIVVAADEGDVGTVRKLSSIGVELWSTTIPDFTPTDVAIDSQQNILVSGNGDGDGWVRKLAP
jgi:cysteine-rich repeat protein